MFGKKPKKSENNASGTGNKARPDPASRIHGEALGDVWAALTGQNPASLMPQIVATVLHDGGTRPAWQWKRGGKEYILMAWPQDQPLRASVLMGGVEGAQLKPLDASPLLEGYPNDLTIEEVFPHKEGMGADVAVAMLEGQRPMWFFDPLYGRDKDDLTPGVTHTFWLSAVALGIRKALLDYVTLAQGEEFEAYAEDWLKLNPGKTCLDVPPLKIEIKDRHFIMPGRRYGEYQLRAVIEDIEECQFEKMPVKALHLAFPFDNRPAMHMPLFASQYVLGNYAPEKGQEIEAYAWFQGRIIDLEENSPEAEARKP